MKRFLQILALLRLLVVALFSSLFFCLHSRRLRTATQLLFDEAFFGYMN